MKSYAEMGKSGGGADRCRIQDFYFPFVVGRGTSYLYSKWVLSLPCGIYEDHSNTGVEIILREAYEIKGLLYSQVQERETWYS